MPKRNIKHALWRTPEARREEHLRRKYGLDLETFEEFVRIQDGKCSICKRVLDRENPDRVCVDHDHKTNKTRSIVCKRCNLVLGMVDNDIELLGKYVTYLKVFKTIHNES